MFLEESFDPDAFASNILASNKDSNTTSTVEDCVSSLTSYLSRIDGEITKLVERNESAMMAKSSSVEDLKSKLSDTTSEARSLEISMHQIRTNMLDPYHNILKRSVRSVRFTYLYKSLTHSNAKQHRYSWNEYKRLRIC